MIPPGGTAQAQWMVTHPVSAEMEDYRVQIEIRHRADLRSSCAADVRIPRLIPPLAVTISAGGPLTFCDGDSVRLDAGAGYATYAWNTGAMTRTIVARADGFYKVTVTDSLGRQVTHPGNRMQIRD